jgi:DNA-binding PadR family transcriptional regulator
VIEFMRGAVRVHVLYHAAHGEVYGAWIIEELGRHGHRLGPGTLYPMLQKMQAEGLLTSRFAVVDGHRRRCYRITRVGRTALRSAQKAVRELADEVLD